MKGELEMKPWPQIVGFNKFGEPIWKDFNPFQKGCIAPLSKEQGEKE
jgi:hypothetical protein